MNYSDTSQVELIIRQVIVQVILTRILHTCLFVLFAAKMMGVSTIAACRLIILQVFLHLLFWTAEPLITMFIESFIV